MSRIGKLPISLPSGVEVKLEKKNRVKVKGPKGELEQAIDPDITVELENNSVHVKRPTDQKRHKALHGLYRTLINNMIIGVSQGYEINMEVVGVGYKADAKGQFLELSVGYSHPIVMVVPKELKVETETKRGEAPKIKLTGTDKQLIGQIAAKIRSFRPPEPYKGKGIRFKGEQIRRKAGKTGK